MPLRNRLKLTSCLLLGLLTACTQPAQYGEKTAGKEAVRDLHVDCELSMLSSFFPLAKTCDGERIVARLTYINGITHDSDGNLYVTDGETIRKVSSEGNIQTLAGWENQSQSDGKIYKPALPRDGQGEDARFILPMNVTYSPVDHVLYISEYDTIRQINMNGDVKTVAGTLKPDAKPRQQEDGTPIFLAPQDGDRHTARPGQIDAMTIDQAGNFYIVNEEWGLIKKIDANGDVTTVYGPTNKPYKSYDATTGEFTQLDSVASAKAPTTYVTRMRGIAIDHSGNLFVVDNKNNVIWKIDTQHHASIFAGQSGKVGYQDGVTALLNYPDSLTIDSADNLYLAEAESGVVRKISPTGTVSTLAGQAGRMGNRVGPARQARFNHPDHLTVDASGNVFVVDTTQIKKISPDGQVSYVTGKTSGAKYQTTLKPAFIQPE